MASGSSRQGAETVNPIGVVTGPSDGEHTANSKAGMP